MSLEKEIYEVTIRAIEEQGKFIFETIKSYAGTILQQEHTIIEKKDLEKMLILGKKELERQKEVKTLEQLGYNNSIKNKKYLKKIGEEMKKIELEDKTVRFYEYEKKYGINAIFKTYDEILAIADIIRKERNNNDR